MIRTTHVGVALAFAALLSVPPSVGALAQPSGCKQTAQGEGTRQNQAQAEGTRQNLAQAENSSSGGGMYGRQYSQAEGNRQNYAQAEGNRKNYAKADTPRLASGAIPGKVHCP